MKRSKRHMSPHADYTEVRDQNPEEMEKTEPTIETEAKKTKAEQEKTPEESDLEMKVTKFCELTSLPRQEAAFRLECHKYDLQDALSSYFEDEDYSISQINNVNIINNSIVSPFNNTLGDGVGNDFKEQESEMLDRDPKKIDSPSFLDQLKEHLQISREPSVSSKRKSASTAFTETAEEIIPSTLSASRSSESVVPADTRWKDATVDGILRRLDAAENASWESPTKKQCLEELSPANERPVAPADLVKQNDNYQEVKEPPKPIEGVGNTSDEQTTAETNISTTAATSTEESANGTPPSPDPSAENVVVVDESSPSVTIELWLADGTILYPRFNYHHTIGDIHAYIDAERPFRTREYWLEMLRVAPPIMTDPNETIQLAAVENLVFIQNYLPYSTRT